MTAHFIVIMKNENIEKRFVETIIPNHKSYKDYFDVYTINDN